MKLLGYGIVIMVVSVFFVQSPWLSDKVFGSMAEAIDPTPDDGHKDQQESVSIVPRRSPGGPPAQGEASGTPASFDTAPPDDGWAWALEPGKAYQMYVYLRDGKVCSAVRQHGERQLLEMQCQ